MWGVKRGDGGKRGGEKEKERKRGVSNSSDRGTPQTKRNCLLHCQLMAIPASSPLNMKHKHNVHTIRHFSITGPHRLIWVYVGITTVTTTHRVIYTSLWATTTRTTTRPPTNKKQINETQSTETTNNESRYDYAGYLSRAQPATTQVAVTPTKKNLRRRPTSCHSITTTPPPTSAELTTRQHSSNKTTPLRLDSSSSSYHNDSKIALQTTTMIPTLSSSNTWLTEQQLTNQPCQKEKEKKGINTQRSWQTVASVGPPKTHHQDRNPLITPQQLTE